MEVTFLLYLAYKFTFTLTMSIRMKFADSLYIVVSVIRYGRIIANMRTRA